MLYKVDFSTVLSRALYDTLYQRVLRFALANNEAEELVKVRFSSLVMGDNAIHLLINLDETKVTAHCLINFQKLTEDTYQAFIEQMEIDSGHDKEFVLACEDYIKYFPTVTRILMLTDENKFRAFRKRYEFEVLKVFMVKELKRGET